MLNLLLKSYSYQHIDVDGAGIAPVIMIWSLYIGVVLASAAAIYNKSYVGGIVRQIIAKGAVGEENAMTLDEMGITGKFKRLVFRRNVIISKTVVCKNAEDFPVKSRTGADFAIRRFLSLNTDGKRNIDADSAKFYIPENIRAKTEIRFEYKGTKPATVVLAFIFVTAVFYLATIALPELLQFLDNAVGYIKSLQ